MTLSTTTEPTRGRVAPRVALMLLAGATPFVVAGSCSGKTHELITVGFQHSAEVTAADLTCWGDDSQDQCDVPPGSFLTVNAGEFHTCGLLSDGRVECWGDNTEGQSLAPAGDFADVAAGFYHTCAINDADDTVQCWGNEWVADEALIPESQFSWIDGGYLHACGVNFDSEVECWGLLAPLDIPEVTDPEVDGFVRVATGLTVTCGLREDESIDCWGSDESGQASPPDGEFIWVDVGDAMGCAIRKFDGSIVCWGDTGPVGDDPVISLSRATQLAVGEHHMCARTRDRLNVVTDIQCWGDDRAGEAFPP